MHTIKQAEDQRCTSLGIGISQLRQMPVLKGKTLILKHRALPHIDYKTNNRKLEIEKKRITSEFSFSLVWDYGKTFFCVQAISMYSHGYRNLSTVHAVNIQHSPCTLCKCSDEMGTY